MIKTFSDKKRRGNKNSARCLVIDIKHPVKTKPSFATVSKNRLEFSKNITNKTRFIADGAKTIFVRIVSTRLAMIIIALTLALGGFFIAAAPASQFNADITEGTAIRANANPGLQSIYAQILGFLSPVSETPALISSFREFNRTTAAATEATQALRAEWFSLMWSDGEELIAKLEKAENETKAVANVLANIKDGMTSLGTTTETPRDLLALQSKTQKEAEFLSKMMNLVRGESVIAVFFTNNMERETPNMIIESYATARIANGEIKNILARNIPRPDQFAETKIILRVPFINIGANKEEGKINQVFDFLASAPQMLGFLESSPIYADEKIKFDGAIVVNYEVIADILRITGPIKLPDTDIVFDQNNFLTEIRKKDLREPTLRDAEQKNTLTLFLPEIISRIQKMSKWEMRELTSIINRALENKNIQFYFVDDAKQATNYEL